MCSYLEKAQKRHGTLDFQKLEIQWQEQPPSEEELFHILGQEIFSLVSCPCPLRDRWIEAIAGEFAESGGKLSEESYSSLVDSLYLESTKSQLGLLYWNQLEVDNIYDTVESTDELLDLIRSVFPNYSENRNRVALRVKDHSPYGVTYLQARKIDSLVIYPGEPLAIIGEEALLKEGVLQFFVSLLKHYGDEQTVEVLLYVLDFGPEPYAKEFVEYSLGRTLDDVFRQVKELTNLEQELLLHSVFGGPDGIFARENTTALGFLARRIAIVFSSSQNLSKESEEFLFELSSAILYKCGFTIQTRVEALHHLLTWWHRFSRDKDFDSERANGELIFGLAHALGPGGISFIQSIAANADLLPEETRRVILRMQDDSPYSRGLIPFHALRDAGVSDVVLGQGKGSASKGEVHRVLALGGKEMSNLYVKIDRPDTIAITEAVYQPFLKLSEVIQKFNRNWSPVLVESSYRSVVDESRNFHREAKRTEEWVAETVCSVLGGRLAESPLGWRVEREDAPPVIVARAATSEDLPPGTPVPVHNRRVFFLYGLGEEFVPKSRLEREQVGDDFKRYCLSRGSDIEELATTVCELFLNSLIESGVLFGDLHGGNAGFTVDPKSGESCLAFLDFGGVQEDFSPRWRDWLVSLSGTILEHLQGSEGAWQKLEDRVRYAILFDCTEREEQTENLAAMEKSLIELKAQLRVNDSPVTDLEELTKMVYDLYTTLPFPNELVVALEGARKVLTDWGRYVNGEKLAERVVPSLFSALERIQQEGTLEEQCVALRERTVHRAPQELYEAALEARAHRDLSEVLEVLPDGTEFSYLDDSGQWRTVSVLGEYLLGTRMIQFVSDGRKAGKILGANTCGFFTIRSIAEESVFLSVQEWLGEK